MSLVAEYVRLISPFAQLIVPYLDRRYLVETVSVFEFQSSSSHDVEYLYQYPIASSLLDERIYRYSFHARVHSRDCILPSLVIDRSDDRPMQLYSNLVHAHQL